MVGTRLITTALRNSFRAFHDERTTFLAILVFALVDAERPGGLGFDGVFTVGIIGTAIENTKAAATLSHLTLVTDRTFDPGRHLRCILIFFNEFTFRVIVAGDKFAVLAITLDEIAFATLRTELTSVFGSLDYFAFESEGTGTFGEFGAAVELSAATELDDHIAPTHRAFHFTWCGAKIRHFGELFFGLYFFSERAIEIA